MNQCDTNKDGKISFQEFVTRLRVAADRSYDYKKPVDVNGISVKDFCAALVNTGVLVGNAIPNAVEGTLVSVARDMTQSLTEPNDLLSLITQWHENGKKELAKTPEQLQVDGKFVLKEAGVVDSGAAGFVFMVEGMLKACQGTLAGMDDPNLLKKAKFGEEGEPTIDVDHSVGSKFQFCTEAVIKLKEGMSKDDVTEAFQSEIDNAELGDSYVIVQAPAKEGGQMAKVHIHSNSPVEVFNVALKFSENEKKLEKEKVEDMFAERENTHGKKIDMSNAKFAVLTDGISTPPSQLDLPNFYLIPVTVTPNSTGDPLIIGDYKNDDPLELFMKLRKQPERVFTAAPTPINIQVEMEAALAKWDHLIVPVLGGWASATLRNCNKALAALSPDLQARVTLFDSGWLGSEHGAMITELFRCAALGLSVEESMKKMYHVEKTAYHFFFTCSQSMKALAKAGRVKALGDGSQIQDGQNFIMGLAPPQAYGEKRENPPTSMLKAASWFGLLEQCEAGDENAVKMEDDFFTKLKGNLKEGHMLKDVQISTIGRPDRSHALAAKMKRLLPVEGEISVVDPSNLYAAASVWGESQVLFWLGPPGRDY